jgi:hypothetical protein
MQLQEEAEQLLRQQQVQLAASLAEQQQEQQEHQQHQQEQQEHGEEDFSG